MHWTIAGVFALCVLVAIGVVWLFANAAYRRGMSEAEAAWADISGRAQPAALVYDPEMVAGLPEIARRYFSHAIAPGTSLFSTVELTMEGPFYLGSKDDFRTFSMTGRQILAPPNEFVWIAKMNSGPMIVSGSDALFKDRAWTRFWMFWSIPLVQGMDNPDIDLSAAGRPSLESVWAPATLLPQNGVRWEQLAPDRAKVSFGTGDRQAELFLTIAENGRVIDMVTQRWGDGNSQKTYQFQPFGGTMEEEATFGGFTIPTLVHVGWHFGTEDFFAFFNARITAAKFY